MNIGGQQQYQTFVMQIHAVVMAVKTMLLHAPPIASHSFSIESKLDNSLLYSQLAMEAHNMILSKSSQRILQGG